MDVLFKFIGFFTKLMKMFLSKINKANKMAKPRSASAKNKSVIVVKTNVGL